MKEITWRIRFKDRLAEEYYFCCRKGHKDRDEAVFCFEDSGFGRDPSYSRENVGNVFLVGDSPQSEEEKRKLLEGIPEAWRKTMSDDPPKYLKD